MRLLRSTRYSKVLRTWIWITLGLVVVDVSRKVPEFLDPCFQKILPLFPKNIGLGFWMDFDLAPTWQKCNEKGLGRRGSRSFGYETVEPGMRWAGGQGQNSVMVISDFLGKVFISCLLYTSDAADE